MIRLSPESAAMMIVTLVPPVVMTSIGHGVRAGMLLAMIAAAGMLIEFGGGTAQMLAFGRANLMQAFSVLALVPAAAALSRPVSVMRQRLALLGDLEAGFDPRKGFEATLGELAEILRRSTGAEVVALVLPSAAGATAVLNTVGDGSFGAGAEVHRRIEALLGGLPACAMSFERRRSLGPRVHVHGPGSPAAGTDGRLGDLAALLDVRSLIISPLMRYGRAHGHVVLGRRATASLDQDASALAEAAPELLRMIETADLVDKLQEESAAHERSRIGLDLHDSAIQPYLGLKYAVEALAMRVAPGHPLHGQVRSLVELVDTEIAELREVVAGLRAGAPRGDNALVPAVRRQARRFSSLFSVDVHLDLPEQLKIGRELAAALFHMLNEALNNVRRHTPARQVWVGLIQTDDAVTLTVRDDAGSVRGTPMPEFLATSLAERTAAMGGTLAITRPDGLNTQTTITVPSRRG
ncbi:MAG: hypothetical protein KGM91_18650 [Burkholderiales bacterium]|nr:hypothetical protein [Burkholderiales bacterium]